MVIEIEGWGRQKLYTKRLVLEIAEVLFSFIREYLQGLYQKMKATFFNDVLNLYITLKLQ